MKNRFKKIQIAIGAALFSLTMNSQQIGNGLANQIDDFNQPLFSGTYNGFNPIGSSPEGNWQHLLVIRHPNPSNNFQLQIASMMGDNDKLYFRKLASGSATSINTNWNELATRGANYFNGNQIISGNVGIGISNPTEKLEIYTSETTPAVISLRSFRNDAQYVDVGRISAKQGDAEVARIAMPRSGEAISGYLTFWTKEHNNANLTEKVRIEANGNVGVGMINPKNKLDVKGTIHSQEVKVDMLDWSDFVFKKEYNLPTLKEVEKYIAEKGHLENIPSEKDVIENGINLGEINAKLLQKIEELTLYVIEQNKKIEKLQEENTKINDLEKRLLKIENKK